MKTLIVSLCLIFLFAWNALAASPLNRPEISKDAEIVAVRADSWIKFIAKDDWNAAVSSQNLTAGDSLKTGMHGKLDILFIDGTQIKVQSRTMLIIREVRRPSGKKGTILGLQSGEIWSRAKSSPEGLRIETPSATAAIRGTDWDIVVDEKGASYLTVLKGRIELYNDQGKVIVDAGEQAVAEVGKAPVKTFLVRPRDRVQWIISYPIDIADAVSFQTYRRPEASGLMRGSREKAITPEARIFLAQLLYDLKQRDESMKIADEVLASEPRNSHALLLRGYLLLGRGETDPAEEHFRKALENADQRSAVLGNLGQAGVYLQKGEIGKADKIIEGLDVNDALPEVGVVLAQFRAFQGNFSEAIRISAKYAERFPNDERFQVMIADFTTTLDEPEKARAATKAAFAINPNSSAAWTIAGRQHYLQGNSKEAEKSFRRAIEIDPANTLAMSELGKLLLEKGHFGESEEKLTSAIEIDPGVSSYWSRRGSLMNWIEKLPSARADLDKATTLNASDYLSFNGLGVIALKEGRTKEAAEYFQKAGMMEPAYAEPHVFLAIAYYQLEEIEHALEELRLAMTLDPRDPVPHIIANIIYQDTYRPMLAVREASIALELLPNLKSVNPTQDTKRGLSNLGSALLGLGMDEWAGSYAEESFDIFDSSSYRFVSNRFADNPPIYLSANMQSFLLNPMSIGFQSRYQDIVLKPQHNFQVRTSLGFQEGHSTYSLSLIQEGYFRKPFEIDYLLQLDAYQNTGFRDNSESKGYFLTYAFGARPDFRNSFFLYGGLTADKLGEPGPLTRPDQDDYTKKFSFQITGGYNRQLAPKSNLMMAFQSSETRRDFYNPAPLGKTVANPFIASFIKDLGFSGASHIYFDSAIGFFADTTGMADIAGISPLTAGLPAALDTKSVEKTESSLRSRSFHLKHIAEINQDHQLSVGVERTSHEFEIKETDTLRGDPASTIPYWRSVALIGVDLDVIRYYNQGKFEWKILNQSGDTTTAYIDDRWKIADNLLLEAGLFYEMYEDDLNSIRNLNPRIGLSWKFHKNHIARAAAQRRLVPVDPTLGPFTTAGVGFTYPRSEAFPGDIITDYQATVESKWTDKIYTEARIERRNHRGQTTRFEFPDMSFIDRVDVNNRADIISLALNVILTDHMGAFARYTNTQNRNLSGRSELMPFSFILPLKGKKARYEPEDLLAAGLVWVSPRHMKASLTAKYMSSQFTDDDNIYRMPSYWTTDLSLRQEFFKKHMQVSFDVRNLFDTYHETAQKYPGPGRSFYLTLEYRF